MPHYRARCWTTTTFSLFVATISLVVAIFLYRIPVQSYATLALIVFLSLLLLLDASVAALVALGGILALRRDTLEREGRPYFAGPARERSCGLLTRLRRRVLSLMPGSPSRLKLWPGEWVRVKPYSEIAATLDGNGSFEGLPFMPEMLPHCGKRFPVFRRIDKIHDYYTPGTTGLRRVRDAVTLENLRCNGKSHGGCQAACQFVWKEAWLEPVSGPGFDAPSSLVGATQLEKLACRNSADGETQYVCQMTELPKAAPLMWWYDPRHYLRDLWSGNARLVPFVKAVALALFNLAQMKTGGPTAPYREGNDRKPEKTLPLNLQPGEIVRVKSKREIEKTLTKSKNRGLWFDVEMHRYCGGEFRVAERVQNIVAEDSGRMLTMKNPCIVLDGISGTGEYLGLSPQNEFIYWREVWLERVSERAESPSQAAAAKPTKRLAEPVYSILTQVAQLFHIQP